MSGTFWPFMFTGILWIKMPACGFRGAGFSIFGGWLAASFCMNMEAIAVIMNEYALVVGIITLNDVMTTLMGDLVGQGLEEQIVARDENSWLIDGGTPIDDVMRVLDIDEFPQSDNYETIGGFMMFMLRKIPKRTDSVKFSGYKFEVVDIDNYRIDQLLVTRIDNKATALSPKLPDAKDKEESVA